MYTKQLPPQPAVLCAFLPVNMITYDNKKRRKSTEKNWERAYKARSDYYVELYRNYGTIRMVSIIPLECSTGVDNLLALIMMIENEEDRNKASEIYRRYGRMMLYIARSILSDQSHAEDAVSEAFIKIIDNLEKIIMNDCYKTKGFVVIVVRHTALNMLKQQKRDKTVRFEDYMDYSDSEEPVFDDVSIREARAKIADAIAGLHKNYADILYLKFEMDYTHDEISKILGISPENARVRLGRARQALKAQLKKEAVIP